MADLDSATIFAASAKHVTDMLFEKPALEALRQSYARKPEKAGSLSAAMHLMRAHGVAVSQEEEQRWSAMPEAEQISAIVNRMPQQADDQFQSFFLQLSILVTAMTHLRTALEEGDFALAERAMDEAEEAGVGKYINRVALIMVGTQVNAMKHEMQQFSQEVKTKANRLIRGQQDFVTVRKRLAAASYKLNRDGAEQMQKLMPFLKGFIGGNDRATIHMAFQAWAIEMDQMKRERMIEEMYGKRFKECEDRLTAWQQSVIRNATRSVVRHMEQLNERLVGDVFFTWKRGVDAEKFEREHGETIAQLQEKLSNAKTSSVESAQRMVVQMFAVDSEKLLQVAMQAWGDLIRVAYEKKQVAEEAKSVQDRITRSGTKMMESSKHFVQSMANRAETAHRMCYQAWVQVLLEAKREASLAARLDAKAASLTSWGEKRKETGISATERAIRHKEEMIELRVLCAWRVFIKVDKAVRLHQASVDRKREQLTGVQNLFRDFASRLETNIGKDTARDFVFAGSSQKMSGRSRSYAGASGDRAAQQSGRRPGTQQESRRGRDERIVLPEITKEAGQDRAAASGGAPACFLDGRHRPGRELAALASAAGALADPPRSARGGAFRQQAQARRGDQSAEGLVAVLRPRGARHVLPQGWLRDTRRPEIQLWPHRLALR
eukprot:CAMPEP_0176264800 /NCGR_PEP_ID=MMETSP0121_2-20121125/41815_1 /TAXON_ID=160619 /ORGANISM="Kryptoperidinium foliaceum, Strain CCMP 1326" /LENGTH=663 /DNA_ID=CAMNT_0017604813 /DNA_START=14 /DNA_END=2002 /DNA_ORIENTATION=+